MIHAWTRLFRQLLGQLTWPITGQPDAAERGHSVSKKIAPDRLVFSAATPRYNYLASAVSVVQATEVASPP
jgi:hypothetical protein